MIYWKRFYSQDITSDLVSFTVQNDYGKIISSELILYNPQNKYGENGSNELNVDDFIELRAGWKEDEFGEEDFPTMADRNKWPFRGNIIEIEPDGAYHLRIICSNCGYLAANRSPQCEYSYNANKSTIEVIKGVGNTSEIFPNPTINGALTYVWDGAPLFKIGYPTVFNVLTKHIDVSGIVNDGGFIDYIFEAINGAHTDNVFKNIQKLVDGLGYHAEWKTWGVDSPVYTDYPRLFIQPRYYHGQTYPSGGTGVNASSAYDLFLRQQANETAQFNKKMRFKYGKDKRYEILGWDAGGIYNHDVKKTKNRKKERVVLYGKKSLGIVGVSGLTAGYITEIIFSDESVVKNAVAQIFTDIKKIRYEDNVFEGIIEADFNWRMGLGYIIQLIDSTLGWIGNYVKYLQCVGYKHIWTAQTEFITEITVGMRESTLDTLSQLSMKTMEIESMKLFMPTGTTIFCNQNSEEEANVDDESYGFHAGIDFTCVQGSGTREIDLTWDRCYERVDLNLEEIMFYQYQILYKKGATPPTSTADADGWFQASDYFQLGLIATESLTVDMPPGDPADQQYSFLMTNMLDVLYYKGLQVVGGTGTCNSGV